MGVIWSYTRGGCEMWPTHMWVVVHPQLGFFFRGGQHLNSSTHYFIWWTHFSAPLFPLTPTLNQV